jgi:hypothetical protein
VFKSIKNICFIFLISCLLCFILPSNSTAQNIHVQLEGERISLKADKTPLRTILAEIVSQGITVKLDPQINPSVSADFSSKPIEQVFSSILKSASYSLLWESKKKEGNSPSINLAEIQIFQSGRKDLMKPLLPPQKFVIAKNKNGSFYAKNEILLKIPIGSNIDELAKFLQQFNATLIESKIPGIVRVVFPEGTNIQAIIREIRNNHTIDSADLNYAYPINAPISYPSTFQQPELEAEFQAPASNLAPIAVLDSGLATDEIDFDKFILSSLDALNPAIPINDTLGHGTQMALVASGLVKPYGTGDESVAYNPIIAIKAFDDNGYTTDFNIMNSINFALENNARVMSLSWGSETKSVFMEKAFEYARSKGLIIVASAGNDPTGTPVYPAAYPSVIGVGALGPHGKKNWNKSNYGSFVALSAPGFANMPVGHNGDPGIYAGTSISAAYVANTIATFLAQNPTATTQEVLEYLNSKY